MAIDDADEDDQEAESARLLLDQMADKWTIRIFWAFCPDMEALRFNELKRRVGRISKKMLSERLRQLERNGLLDRRVLPGRVLGVEYAVTSLGLSLKEPLSNLFRWAENASSSVEAAKKKFDDNNPNKDRR